MSKHQNYDTYYKSEPVNKVPSEKGPVAEKIMETLEKTEQKVEVPAPAPKPKKKYATVTGGKPCKMRFKPNKKAQVINIIPFKAKVTVLDEAGEWWKVRYKDITGYMMSQFLKKE